MPHRAVENTLGAKFAGQTSGRTQLALDKPSKPLSRLCLDRFKVRAEPLGERSPRDSGCAIVYSSGVRENMALKRSQWSLGTHNTRLSRSRSRNRRPPPVNDSGARPPAYYSSGGSSCEVALHKALGRLRCAIFGQGRRETFCLFPRFFSYHESCDGGPVFAEARSFRIEFRNTSRK